MAGGFSRIAKFALMLGGSAGALLVSSAAFAQAAPSQPAAPGLPQANGEPAAATSPGNSQSQATEIIVTGSRIARKDYSSNTPIVTLGAQAIEKTGSPTLDTSLTRLPQFVASTGSATNSSGNQGQANIQLRGLGRQRTLVLLDGRRIVPSNSDGSVDINLLPTMLIENVEIITGGASAVYGSDAVGGVVNVRLKHHFRGLEVDAQNGISSKGDAATHKIGVAGGFDFAGGRGSSIFSAEYAKRDPIFLSDRAYTVGANRDSVLPQGIVSLASSLPSQAAVDAVFAQYGVAPGAVSPQNTFGFNGDGTLFSTGLSVVNYRGSTSPTQFTVTPSRVYAEGRGARYLQLPLETYTFFNRTTYRLGADTQIYLQGFYSHSTGATQLNPLPAPSSATAAIPPVPVTNPFIPADLQTLLASRGDPDAPFALSLRFDAIGPRLNKETDKAGQIVTGVQGPLGVGDLTYNIYGSYGENAIRIDRSNYISRSALYELLYAPDGGASLCNGGFNPFGTESISASCAALLAPHTWVTENIKQVVAEADVQGGIVDLPAGQLRFAAGFDYRYDRFSASADPQTESGDIIAASGSDFSGSTNTKEAYGELLIPILSKLPLIRKLDADVGFRYSDYNSVGSVWTYKGDLNWSVAAGFSLRGGYERAIRAPSVGELYSPIVQNAAIIGLAGALGSGDPCDVNGAYRSGANAAKVRSLCIAQGVPQGVVDTYTFPQQSAGVTTGGNPNLKQETADTYSAGIVWRSPFQSELLRNLSLSFDYYKIDLKDAIGSITAPLVLSRCFNASGSTNPDYDPSNTFCSLISRNADGTINTIATQSLNLSGYRTSGFDLEVDWRMRTEALGLHDGGELSVNFLANKLRKFEIQSLPGDAFLDYAGTIGNGQIDPVAISRPKWKSTLYASYSNGPFLVGMTWRYIGKMSNAANVGNSGNADGVPSRSYFDLNASVKVNKSFELWGSIANIGDVRPPVYPSTGLSDFSTYDAIGRYFTLGVKAHF